MTSYAKRQELRKQHEAIKEHERELKEEKEAERQVSSHCEVVSVWMLIAEQAHIQRIKERRAAKEEKERYDKMAEKMHHKRVERLKRKEKRNKLLNSWSHTAGGASLHIVRLYIPWCPPRTTAYARVVHFRFVNFDQRRLGAGSRLRYFANYLHLNMDYSIKSDFCLKFTWSFIRNSTGNTWPPFYNSHGIQIWVSCELTVIEA